MPFLAALPAAVGLGISALAPVVGGAIGSMASAGDKAKAQQAMQEAFDQINQVGAPPDLAQQILMNKFQSAGVLTPELEKSINLGVSQMSQVQGNTQAKNAQQQALQLIQQRAQGGLSGQDRANINNIQQQTAQDAEAKRQQILQNFQQRGQAGAGSELAAQLSAAQGGAQNEAQQGFNVGAAASQNALSALAQQGGLSGQMENQAFGENSAKAQAADAFNQFNVSNQIAQQARNVGAQNQSQAMNLQNAQNLSNQNTQTSNQELLRENQAREQMYQDQMSQAQAKANALSGQGQYYQNQAQNTAQGWQNVGSGIGAAGGSMATFSALQGLMNKNNPTATPNPTTPTKYTPDTYGNMN